MELQTEPILESFKEPCGCDYCVTFTLTPAIVLQEAIDSIDLTTEEIVNHISRARESLDEAHRKRVVLAQMLEDYTKSDHSSSIST
jgi:hypothetical protein